MRLSATALLVLPALLLGCRKEDPESPPVRAAFSAVSTLAGSGQDGHLDGPGPAAQFSYPEGVVADAQGNVYVADAGSPSIRKITAAGVVSTLAGSGRSGYADGPAASALFGTPADLVLDSRGNLFVADYTNHRIRKITPAGVVSTFAGDGQPGLVDGPAASARFNEPNGLAIDAQDVLYVADEGSNSIRKVTPAGVVSTLAGGSGVGYADGAGSQARFARPQGLALDRQGTLYVAELAGYRVRKIAPNGTVSTLAGTGTTGTTNGPAGSARFGRPAGVAVDAQGTVYVADMEGQTIRLIAPDGTVSTLAGTGTRGAVDGSLQAAQFDQPSGIALDALGNLLVTEYGNRVRKISAQ